MIEVRRPSVTGLAVPIRFGSPAKRGPLRGTQFVPRSCFVRRNRCQHGFCSGWGTGLRLVHCHPDGAVQSGAIAKIETDGALLRGGCSAVPLRGSFLSRAPFINVDQQYGYLFTYARPRGHRFNHEIRTPGWRLPRCSHDGLGRAFFRPLRAHPLRARPR